MKEKQALHLISMTRMENELWNKGLLVAGADEAGRGPLAGPVVAACVIMPPCPLILDVNDSKKLSAKKRERLYGEIIREACEYGVGVVEHNEIDDINILNAAKKAFMLAAGGVKRIQYMLCDAIGEIDFGCPSESIVKGDAKSYSIAAASIIAKVTRDNIMLKYDKLYPQYGFARNKGYGTKDHYDAIYRHGTCPIHRLSFLKRVLYYE